MGARPEAINGDWGDWGPWSDCSRSCGGGLTYSERDCNNPIPANKGRYCLGQRKRMKVCNPLVVYLRCYLTQSWKGFFSLVLMVVQRFDNNNAPRKTRNLGMENTTLGYHVLWKVCKLGIVNKIFLERKESKGGKHQQLVPSTFSDKLLSARFRFKSCRKYRSRRLRPHLKWSFNCGNQKFTNRKIFM